jgi:hypothetical protein
MPAPIIWQQSDAMTRLAELQRQFAVSLRQGTDGDDSDPAVLFLASGSDELTAAQRIGIYRHHHRSSLMAALTTHYPTILALIGAAAFDVLAADFVRAVPPDDARLACYGAGFADFLVADPRLADLPYLADSARLDWALIKGQVAATEAAITAADLAAIDAAQLADLRCRLHPAASQITSVYPLLQLRRLAGDATAEAAPVDLASGGTNLLVWRQLGEMVWQELDPAASAFVTALAARQSLGEAAAQINESLLPALIGRCLLSGAFCRENAP